MIEDEGFRKVHEPEEDPQGLTSEEGMTRYAEEFPMIAK